MAVRICFLPVIDGNKYFKEVEVEFTYYNGFSISQKQKSIESFHEGIRKLDNNLVALEVSTKSLQPVGRGLSAFNLQLKSENTNQSYAIENVFQSSKVFSQGGPFRDLLEAKPHEAKRDLRLKSSGDLVGFNYNDIDWGLDPKTMFYDYIYLSALSRDKELSLEVMKYNAFTDIEFNHKKSINCQARAVAIFVSLVKRGVLEEFLQEKSKFVTIYNNNKIVNNDQISLFD